MHLTTSPPSEPHAGHQHCTRSLPVSPFPSSAVCLPGHPTSLPYPLCPPLSYLACACPSSPLGQELTWGVPAVPLFGETRCRCLELFVQGQRAAPHTDWTV